MEYGAIPLLIRDIAKKNADLAAFRFKKDGTWVDVMWPEALETVTRISKSLVALGVEFGDRICILSQTRLEWALSDFGIVTCGGVTVGIYQSNLGPDCAYIVNHSDAFHVRQMLQAPPDTREAGQALRQSLGLTSHEESHRQRRRRVLGVVVPRCSDSELERAARRRESAVLRSP